LANLASISKS